MTASENVSWSCEDDWLDSASAVFATKRNMSRLMRIGTLALCGMRSFKCTCAAIQWDQISGSLSEASSSSLYYLRTVRTLVRFALVRLHGCAGSPEPSLYAWWVNFSHKPVLIIWIFHDCWQACHISGFRPEITGFFIALPALRLSRENLRQNHKISGICFFFWQHFKLHRL